MPSLDATLSEPTRTQPRSRGPGSLWSAPSRRAWASATAVALAGSLGVDALLVVLGQAAFPSTAGYPHYRFWDYGGLTTLGVLGAGAAWTLVIRTGAAPRRLLFRLAVAVTLVLWLPDLWLVSRREPIDAVGVLMVMHLAVAVITYQCLVHLAPARPPGQGPPRQDPAHDQSDPRAAAGAGKAEDGPARDAAVAVPVWIGMLSALGLELVLGVVALVMVPVGRPNGWLPVPGRPVYLAHAIVGGLLGLAALAVLGAVWRSDRITRLAGAGGLVGVALGAVGGILTVDHPTRALGIALMLVGSLLAGFAYMVPIVEALPDPPPPTSALGGQGDQEPW